MCWCRIRLVLLGLLGLLCVVHVVSGMCGQTYTDVQSSALNADLVMEGKVRRLYKPNSDRSFNASVSVRKTVPKGRELLVFKGKSAKKVKIGQFQAVADPENCIGSLKLGYTYIFFLKQGGNISRGLYFELSAMPEKKSKKRFKKIKKVLCDDCAKAPTVPQIIANKKREVKLNKKATIKCSAKAVPLPLYTWFKNGVPLTPRDGLRIKNSRKYSKIRISKVGRDDVGEYTCVATNAVGSQSATLKLKVHSRWASGSRAVLCDSHTYCLNGGTCWRYVKLDDGKESHCQCTQRYTGRRCQLKAGFDLFADFNHQASLLYERTLIIVGLVIAVICLGAILIASYILAKRRRKRFEAKRKRKEAWRTKEKERSVAKITVEKYTPSRDEEKTRKLDTNQYGTAPGTDRLLYENDNGFDFHKQQTQPLLYEHQLQLQDTTDGAGPESRRRLVASSVYDNTDEPATIWPSSVQGLTTAEVLITPEVIEMDQLPPSSESRSKDIEKPSSDPPQTPPNQPLHHPSSSFPPYNRSEPQPHDNNNISHQQPAPVLPISKHEITSSLADHLPSSNRNSQCSNNDPENSADSFVLSPSSRSLHAEVNPLASDDSSRQNDVSTRSTNDLESPSEEDSRNISDSQNNTDQQFPDEPSPQPPPSYQAAVKLLGHQPHAMMFSTDTDSDDDNAVRDLYQNTMNGLPEDLHISEEDLNLSRENLVSSSFNSLSNPSRQVSVDGDLQRGASVTSPEHCHPKIRKHQSDDIHNGHLWNPLLPTETFRSQSLDTPGPISSKEESLRKKHHNHLSSTVAGSQDGLMQSSGAARFNHVNNSFDPSDDSPPWDADASRAPNYLHIMNEEEDQMNRLRDVCPDQPAIPI